MASEEFTGSISIHGSNNDSNLLLNSSNGIITENTGKAENTDNVTNLEIDSLNKKIESLLGNNDILFDKGVTDIQAPEIINNIPTGAKPGRKTIHLGLLNDYSGPYSTLAPPIETSLRLFWKNVNEQSLLGDKFNIVVDEGKDTGYNPVKHKEGYLSMKDNILALSMSLGTVQTEAIYPDMVSDNILANPMSWWSGWDKPEYKNVLSFGASYFVDAINTIDYIIKNDSRKDNLKKVFIAGFAGDYGGDYSLGTKYACENISSLEFVGEYLLPVMEFNVATCIQQVIQSEADIICLAVGPQQSAQIYGGLLQSLGNAFSQKVFCLAAPSFNDAFVAPGSQLAQLFLAGNTYLSTFVPDLTNNSPGNQKLISLLSSVNLTSRSNFLTAGYISQLGLFNVLKKSIEKGDIRRSSLIANVDETEFDYEGMMTKKLHKGLKLDSYIVMPGETPSGVKTLGFNMSYLLVTRGTTPP